MIATEEIVLSSNRKIEDAERFMLDINKPVECPVNHYFAPHVYVREILMHSDGGKGVIIIGHEHKTEHLNTVLIGKAWVVMDGVIHHIVAPCTFKSMPGVRKVLFVYEDMIWQTVHPTDETDLGKLTEMLIKKSESFLQHAEDLKLLQSEALKLAQSDAN